MAIWLAARPSTLSLTSMTCHARLTSAGRALYVLVRHLETLRRTGGPVTTLEKDGPELDRGLAAPSQAARRAGVPWRPGP